MTYQPHLNGSAGLANPVDAQSTPILASIRWGCSGLWMLLVSASTSRCIHTYRSEAGRRVGHSDSSRPAGDIGVLMTHSDLGKMAYRHHEKMGQYMASASSPLVTAIVRGILGTASAAGLAAVVTIAYTMWHDSKEESAANGETRASLAFTKGQLAEKNAENLKLKDEIAVLRKTTDDLRQELITEQVNNRYDRKMLEESTTKQSQLSSQVVKLSSALAKSDPCAPLREAIDGLERDLQLPEHRLQHLNEMQRKQAEVSLAKKYQSLDVCLSASR